MYILQLDRVATSSYSNHLHLYEHIMSCSFCLVIMFTSLVQLLQCHHVHSSIITHSLFLDTLLFLTAPLTHTHTSHTHTRTHTHTHTHTHHSMPPSSHASYIPQPSLPPLTPVTLPTSPPNLFPSPSSDVLVWTSLHSSHHGV